jgi:glutathione synthase/RimK-type ligase-like ATP-grasp enzyme
MKKVLVIGSADYGKKNNPLEITQALKNAQVDSQFIAWEELVFDIETNTVSVKFNNTEISSLKPDLVIAVGWYKSGNKSIYRDVALSLSQYLMNNKIEFWNSEMSHQRSTGKLSCMVKLAFEGISVPKTLFSLNGDLLLDKINFPAVIKASDASRGESNFLVREGEEASQKLKASGDVNHMLIQPYLENDHDLRVICFGGEPSLVLRRSRGENSQSHMNNTSQGGSAEWLEIDKVDPSLLTDSKKICIVMNREMAGIDFIPDSSSPSGYACLEVNAVPQLTSGFDADHKLAVLAQSIAKR